MKIKTFASFSENRLDKKVNAFIQNNKVEVKDIKFSAAFGFVAVCIIYTEK